MTTLLAYNYNVDWSRIWPNIALTKDKKSNNILFKLLAKLLPLEKPHLLCKHCNATETSEHVFFDCPLIRPIVASLNFALNQHHITLNWNLISVLSAHSHVNSNILINSFGLAIKWIWDRQLQRIIDLEWHRTSLIINNKIIQLYNSSNHIKSRYIREAISTTITKFSVNWNTPITNINMPQHFNQYI
eukprot:gene19843-23769_t